MSQAESAIVTPEIEELSSSLLSTLDESLFFGELSSYLQGLLGHSSSKVYKVLEDSSCKLVALGGNPVHDGEELIIGQGPAGHVIRTKRPYFSNNVARDPLFSKEASEGVTAELCIPVSYEGVLIATMHFQSSDEGAEFTRENINTVLEVLKGLKRPLANMKLYLAAKSLNEILLKKIEEKERELEERTNGPKAGSAYQVIEKNIVGKSVAMKTLLALADRVAQSDANVLISGEAGTGKELITRRIHCRGIRAKGSLITVDCSSLDDAQLEIELFGQVGSDFHNGRPEKTGRIEAANGGTILLKRVGHLSPNLQAKLMHFLKEGIAFRVGEQVPYRSDVRIIATTVKDLKVEVEKGHFREDLFYGLSTVSLEVPSLRERREDIEELAIHFLNDERPAPDQKSMSPCVVKALSEYTWPGNIRELQNIIERAYILAESMIIESAHLADCVVKGSQVEEEVDECELEYKEMTLDELEKLHICNTLEHLGGNKTKTAKTLGITVKTLYNKLHSYGMIRQKEA